MTQIRHFDLELAELKRSLVSMGNLVEQSLRIAIDAIIRPGVEAREQVRAIEVELDALETAIEDKCHQIIALQAPVAKDLRFLISATRITSDLEQVGDLAESIAKRAKFIASNQAVQNPSSLATLGELVLEMLRRAMESFVTGNMDVAKQVMIDEEESDRLTKLCYEDIQLNMEGSTAHIREYTRLLRAVGHLEHAADIASSIAEESAYIFRGANIRHSRKDLI